MRELNRQLRILKQKVFEIVPEEEFISLLQNSLESGVPLRVKCGIDPTNPKIHLGHLVPFRKMREFQNLGHTGVVVIGDYTALIGDPTGKNESRPPLGESVIKRNTEEYMDQLGKILDPEKTEVHFQSEWFSKATLKEVMGWSSETTVAKLLGHETFRERLEQGHSLSLHEIFYPVLQGIDSVFINAQVELGGTDQRFNVLMGRDYQKNRGQKAQVAMLLPLIVGTYGKQKMSKSLGNHIGVLDEPTDQFGKIMSLPDSAMKEYFTYLTDKSEEEVEELEKALSSGSLHPNETKKELAQSIVHLLWGEEKAQRARQEFENIFKKGGVPEDCPDYTFRKGELLVDLLVQSKLLSSKAQARRMEKQKAISLVGGGKLDFSVDQEVPEKWRGEVLKVGKRRFLRLF